MSLSIPCRLAFHVAPPRCGEGTCRARPGSKHISSNLTEDLNGNEWYGHALSFTRKRKRIAGASSTILEREEEENESKSKNKSKSKPESRPTAESGSAAGRPARRRR